MIYSEQAAGIRFGDATVTTTKIKALPNKVEFGMCHCSSGTGQDLLCLLIQKLFQTGNLLGQPFIVCGELGATRL